MERIPARLASWGVGRIAVVYALSAAGCCLMAATSRADFIDLHIYRLGGEALIHGTNLYGFRYFGLSFTYPPFAAILFMPVAVLPWTLAAALLTLASALILPVMLYLALRLPPVSSWLTARDAWRIALVTGAAAIWLEPVRTTLGYGQVDLFIGAAVLYDLTRPDSSRYKGIAIGLAAAFKLTPAIFIVYLFITRRYRAAVTAIATFALTIVAGFVVVPGSSAHFWDITFLNPQRVSPVQNTENQSLLGAMSRTLHAAHILPLWLALAIVVAIAGLALAAHTQRCGNEALGFSLCATTGLLVSPISWTHHWVIAVPALLLAAVSLHRDQTRTWGRRVVGMTALAVVAVIGWARLARDNPESNWLHLTTRGLVDNEIYVLAGLAALGLAAYSVLTAHFKGRRSRLTDTT
jgi:alpha-1,2-mannosyltransferase